MSKKPRSFSELSRSGSDFEVLLGRLFEAMGYKVEHTGKSGDLTNITILIYEYHFVG
jgi:hypothetical protein